MTRESFELKAYLILSRSSRSSLAMLRGRFEQAAAAVARSKALARLEPNPERESCCSEDGRKRRKKESGFLHPRKQLLLS